MIDSIIAAFDLPVYHRWSEDNLIQYKNVIIDWKIACLFGLYYLENSW